MTIVVLHSKPAACDVYITVFPKRWNGCLLEVCHGGQRLASSTIPYLQNIGIWSAIFRSANFISPIFVQFGRSFLCLPTSGLPFSAPTKNRSLCAVSLSAISRTVQMILRSSVRSQASVLLCDFVFNIYIEITLLGPLRSRSRPSRFQPGSFFFYLPFWSATLGAHCTELRQKWPRFENVCPKFGMSPLIFGAPNGAIATIFDAFRRLRNLTEFFRNKTWIDNPRTALETTNKRFSTLFQNFRNFGQQAA